MSDTPHLPLSGVIVLDLTLARAGPTCVRHLADWGASIIRIEPPDTGGEDVSGKRDGFDFHLQSWIDQCCHAHQRCSRPAGSELRVDACEWVINFLALDGLQNAI